MSRLWVQLIKHHKMAENETIECAWGDQQQALIELCREMDVPAPMWLSKHEFEFEQFRHTAFTKDHFVEDLPFDRMEVEFIDPDRKKKENPLYY